ncbi:MAG: hypothetical protein MUF61_03285 [archaeon]|jgi:hypothetical protein|nr:hypothetical protein [archaeon]
MVYSTFRKYGYRDADLIQNRLKAFGVVAPSLEDIANSLNLQTRDSDLTVLREKRFQAGCIAEKLEDEGVGARRAYNLAWMVLNLRDDRDIPYLMMWKDVRAEKIDVNHELAQTDAKREILAQYFIDKFGAGQKQDVSYVAVVNRLKERDIKKATKRGVISSKDMAAIEGSDWNLRYNAYIGRVFRNVYRGALKAAKTYELAEKK